MAIEAAKVMRFPNGFRYSKGFVGLSWEKGERMAWFQL